MAYETAMHAPLPPDNLLFDGACYDLGWDEEGYLSTQIHPDSVALPSADYARFLINAVQFHCGQLFHLFEEDKFMRCFTLYHDNVLESPGLWYIHYLLILAFGKAFIVSTSKEQKPPGAEFFVLAMNLLPPAHFLNQDAIHMIEILCCAALYLQCLDFRGPAYRMVRFAAELKVELLLLTHETDRPSATDGPPRRNTYRDVRRRCGRCTCSAMPRCVVDSLYSRPPDVIIDGCSDGYLGRCYQGSTPYLSSRASEIDGSGHSDKALPCSGADTRQ